jgi:hypothetical protein
MNDLERIAQLAKWIVRDRYDPAKVTAYALDIAIIAKRCQREVERMNANAQVSPSPDV